MKNMRVAIVTGASRGIGAAIAQRLAADGVAVVLGYGANAEGAEAVAARIRAEGGTAEPCQAELAEEAGAARLVDCAIRHFGQLDILVNNAAILEGRVLAALDAEHIARHLEINLGGALLAAKHAAARMRAGGSIVNISSINARAPVPGAAVYSASKAALEAATKALARELGPRGIRVNAVAPGLTLTEGLEGVLEDATRARFVERTPLGRLGTAAEVAAAVAFLAGEEASWITGEIIAVTGGYGL